MGERKRAPISLLDAGVHVSAYWHLFYFKFEVG
nr:MAG TPA: hypothetical protein [Bacteriophage sp.]